MVDCNECARRGKVNGLSQESYCSGCIHSGKWKKDYFLKNNMPDESRQPAPLTDNQIAFQRWCD